MQNCAAFAPKDFHWMIIHVFLYDTGVWEPNHKTTVNLYYLRLPHFRIVQKNMNDHSMEVFWGKRCTILHVILAQRRPKNKLQTSCQTFDYSRWSLKLYLYSITEYWVVFHCSIAMSIIYKASIGRGHSPKINIEFDVPLSSVKEQLFLPSHFLLGIYLLVFVVFPISPLAASQCLPRNWSLNSKLRDLISMNRA